MLAMDWPLVSQSPIALSALHAVRRASETLQSVTGECTNVRFELERRAVVARSCHSGGGTMFYGKDCFRGANVFKAFLTVLALSLMATAHADCKSTAEPTTEVGDREIRVCFSNERTLEVTLSRIKLHWPAEAGALLAVIIDSNLIDEPRQPPEFNLAFRSIDESQGQRRLRPGETKELVFRFEKYLQPIQKDSFIVALYFAEDI